MSQAQASLPVLASKPWMTPEGEQRHWPSRIWCGTTMIPRTTVGRGVDRGKPRINPAHTDLGVLLAGAVELGAGLAGQRVDRDQAAVERTFDDPRGAGRVRGFARHPIIDQPAACGRIGNPFVRHLGIDPPHRLAGCRVERDDDVLGGARVEQVTDFQRRVLGSVELRVTRRWSAVRRCALPTPSRACRHWTRDLA